MTLFTWFYCSGCGATLRCKLCKAAECSGLDSANCIGCAAARAERAAIEAKQKGVPWNMRRVRFARPHKHIRKRETAIQRHLRGLYRRGVWGRGGRRWERIRGRWTRCQTISEMLADP